MNFCLRLKGADNSSKVIITTTPTNAKILENIAYNENTAITYGTSYDNEKNLSTRFFENIKAYKNTSFGEQEIYGKIINKSILWRPFHIEHLHKNLNNKECFFESDYDNFTKNKNNKNLENLSKKEILQEIYGGFQEDRNHKIQDLDNQIMKRINEISFPDIEPIIDEYTIGIDPAFGGRSETGIVLVGVTKKNQYYILEDLSGNYSCSVWTRIVRFLSKKFSRCSISIETNHGGGLFKEIFAGHMYIKENRAVESKLQRSISSLIMYENSEVIHYKPFKRLEHQMLNFTPNQNDRVDALVWALKFLKNRYNPNYWIDDEFINKDKSNNLINEKNMEKTDLNNNNIEEKADRNILPIQEDLNILEVLDSSERKNQNDYENKNINYNSTMDVLENMQTPIFCKINEKQQKYNTYKFINNKAPILINEFRNQKLLEYKKITVNENFLKEENIETLLSFSKITKT